VWPEIESAIGRELDDLAVYHTEHPWHAKELTQQALKNGFTRIVSVGGDGTHHEVLNGFFEGYLPINPKATLALVPSGTGSDFARTLRMTNWRDAVPRITGAKTRRIDIGRATFTIANGSTDVRYFMNVADFGIGGAVVERVNKSSKRFGPFITFLWGVLSTLPRYRAQHVRLQIDGAVLEQRTLNVIVAKGEYYGGGIHVAKEARLDNGTFEVLIINELSLAKAIWNLPRYYSGSYVQREDLVRYFRATRVVAQSDERVLLDLDGEQPGQLPAAIELLPAAIELVVG
jgi:diacylglycerol kinase (ATP)